MMVVVSLIMLIITITAISNNVTEVHDGTYRVVIPSRPSAPQLSQQIPTDGRLACNKPAVQFDGEGTAAAQLVHMVLPCRKIAILWQCRKQATSVANYDGVPVGRSVANNCGVPIGRRIANNCGVPVSTNIANNYGVPVSTSSNAHSTHLHLSHPSALQPFVPQLLLHPLLPFCLQSIYQFVLHPLHIGRLCF